MATPLSAAQAHCWWRYHSEELRGVTTSTQSLPSILIFLPVHHHFIVIIVGCVDARRRFLFDVFWFRIDSHFGNPPCGELRLLCGECVNRTNRDKDKSFGGLVERAAKTETGESPPSHHTYFALATDASPSR